MPAESWCLFFKKGEGEGEEEEEEEVGLCELEGEKEELGGRVGMPKKRSMSLVVPDASGVSRAGSTMAGCPGERSGERRGGPDSTEYCTPYSIPL